MTEGKKTKVSVTVTDPILVQMINDLGEKTVRSYVEGYEKVKETRRKAGEAYRQKQKLYKEFYEKHSKKA